MCCPCLADPHVLFDLDPSSEILIVFQSINKNLAQDVDYKRFRDMIVSSPYFNNVYPFDSGRESDMRFPRNSDREAGGRPRHGCHRPERHRRHHRRGELHGRRRELEGDQRRHDLRPGDAELQFDCPSPREPLHADGRRFLACCVSSRHAITQDSLPIERKPEARTNPRIYVYDKRLWEIRPERFNGERFRVFIGDETRKPRILEDNELVAEADERLVMGDPDRVPPDLRERPAAGAARRRRCRHPGAASVHAEHRGGDRLLRHRPVDCSAVTTATSRRRRSSCTRPVS